MDLSLFFAGTGGSVPSPRRGLPAILLRRGGDRLLFDCGEGTQRQLMRSVGLADVGCVFITHFHADHWLGLPGMLKSFALRERDQPLAIYGPPGLAQLMEQTRFIYGRLPYELRVTELEADDDVAFDGYAVAPIRVSHRANSAYGYAIVEDSRPGHLDPKLAEQLGVTPGPDFGRLTRGETVAGVSPEQVMGPTREGRKIVISGDTSPCEMLTLAAHEADLLVHEATFAEEELERAHQTGHSTARQAAQISARCTGTAARSDAHLHALPGWGPARGGPLGVRRDRGATRLRHDRHSLPREGPGRADPLVGSASRQANDDRATETPRSRRHIVNIREDRPACGRSGRTCAAGRSVHAPT